MLHAVATPHGIIHVFESHIGIESFCLRIALIHEQSHGRKAHFPALFYHRLEQHLGDTLATEGSRHGEAVDIEFALLGFRIHTCIVDAEGFLSLLDESLAQRLELKTVDAEMKALQARRANEVSKKIEAERTKLKKAKVPIVQIGERLLAYASELEKAYPSAAEDKAKITAKVLPGSGPLLPWP